MPDPAADLHRRARPPRTWPTAAVSLLLYAAAVFYADASGAGSTLWEGMGHALFFGTFAVVVTFPMLVGLGFLLRGGFERLIRRPLPWRSTLPWFTHVPLSLAMLLTLQGNSPRELFARFVSSDAPRSLSDFHYWKMRGYGHSMVVLSFRIDPSEFPKVLTRHAFVEHDNPDGLPPPELADLARGRPDFPISAGGLSWVHVYEHHEPGDSGGFHIAFYATENRDHVIMIQSTN